MPRQSTTELFWKKVDRSGECWNWTASRLGATAPGAFWYGGQMQSAPRVAWILEHGSPPSDQVRHLCGNVLCVRPEHLEAPSALDRFRRSFEMRGPEECWPWTASVDPRGYGLFGSARTRVHAHRVAWSFWIAPLPPGAHVLHRCDNPPCVNPSHLFVGSHVDNMADMRRKRRASWGERSYSTKLTNDDALYVRERSAAGVGSEALAAELGVRDYVIRRIVKRKTWRHL